MKRFEQIGVPKGEPLNRMCSHWATAFSYAEAEDNAWRSYEARSPMLPNDEARIFEVEYAIDLCVNVGLVRSICEVVGQIVKSNATRRMVLNAKENTRSSPFRVLIFQQN